MKASRARKVSIVIVLVSAGLLAATILLPGIKLPESVTATVPATSMPPGGYQIYGYGIPPVVKGTFINVTLSGFIPNELLYTLSPTEGNIVLSPLAFGRVDGGPVYAFGATAEESYPLELMIIAYNGSGYTINYTGVWSPFDFLLVYTAPAVFLLAASLAATYYFGTRIPRQRNEEKVEAELREEARHGRAGRNSSV